MEFSKISRNVLARPVMGTIFLVYIYIWTPTPITLPRSRCECGACGVIKISCCFNLAALFTSDSATPLIHFRTAKSCTSLSCPLIFFCCRSRCALLVSLLKMLHLGNGSGCTVNYYHQGVFCDTYAIYGTYPQEGATYFSHIYVYLHTQGISISIVLVSVGFALLTHLTPLCVSKLLS